MPFTEDFTSMLKYRQTSEHCFALPRFPCFVFNLLLLSLSHEKSSLQPFNFSWGPPLPYCLFSQRLVFNRILVFASVSDVLSFWTQPWQIHFWTALLCIELTKPENWGWSHSLKRIPSSFLSLMFDIRCILASLCIANVFNVHGLGQGSGYCSTCSWGTDNMKVCQQGTWNSFLRQSIGQESGS